MRNLGFQIALGQSFDAQAQPLRRPSQRNAQQQTGSQAGGHAHQQQRHRPVLDLIGELDRTLCCEPGYLFFVAHQVRHQLVGLLEDQHIFRTGQKACDDGVLQGLVVVDQGHHMVHVAQVLCHHVLNVGQQHPTLRPEK